VSRNSGRHVLAKRDVWEGEPAPRRAAATSPMTDPIHVEALERRLSGAVEHGLRFWYYEWAPDKET